MPIKKIDPSKWAIEAARLGCPYVEMRPIEESDDETEKPCFVMAGDGWKFMGEYDSEEISDDMMARFVCGATVSIWFIDQASQKNGKNLQRLLRLSLQAHSFALENKNKF